VIKLKHSRLAPSAASRWLKCRASIGLIEQVALKAGPEPETESPQAREGTTAHEYGARLLNKVRDPQHPRGNSEMRACIEQGYVPFVRKQVTAGARLAVERPVPIFYLPQETGTPDALVWSPSWFNVNDLKYGEGVSVEAKFNPQLIIYGESGIRKHQPQLSAKAPVKLSIYQPRARDNRFVRRWELTRGELRDHAQEIQTVANAILKDPFNQPFAPDADTTCRWCPAKLSCAHYAAHLLEETPPTVSRQLLPVEHRLDLPLPKEVSASQMAKVLRVKNDLISWLQELETHAVKLLSRGRKLEGFKLVGADTHRKWKDPKAAARLLQTKFQRGLLFEESFLTPAAAARLLKGQEKRLGTTFLKQVNAQIVKPEGAARLALESDPRPPLEIVDVDSEFQDTTATDPLLQ